MIAFDEGNIFSIILRAFNASVISGYKGAHCNNETWHIILEAIIIEIEILIHARIQIELSSVIEW